MVTDLAAILTGKATAATAVSTTRPALAADGVDVSAWKQGNAYQFPSFLVTLTPDAQRTLDSPTDGTLGPEIWSYINSVWVLVAYFRLEAAIIVPAGAYGEVKRDVAVGDRLIVAGTKSAGTVSYSFTPIERTAR